MKYLVFKVSQQSCISLCGINVDNNFVTSTKYKNSEEDEGHGFE